MKHSFIFLITIFLSGCLNKPEKHTSTFRTNFETPQQTYIDTILELEKLSTLLNYDSLGKLILKIRLAVKDNNLQEFKEGKIPWIRIDSPEVDIKDLIGKDEVVIPEANISVIIDYPLLKNYKFELNSKKGFTSAQLIKEIS